MKGNSIRDTFKSTDCKAIADAINRINSSNENSDLEYISLQIPNSAILNKDTSFIKEVKIIDMIGIPDPENTRANRLNSSIIDNIGLDCSFVLKREEGRGKIQPQDLIDQKDSNIFRSRKYLSDQIIQPKLIGVKISNLKQNSRSVQAMTSQQADSINMPNLNCEDIKNRMIKSLSLVCQKNITDQMLREKANKVILDTEYKDQNTYFIFKNDEYKEINSRIEALLIYPCEDNRRKHTVDRLQSIIKETKTFKKKKFFEKTLIQLSQINTFLLSKYFLAMVKQNDGDMFKYLNKNANKKKLDSANIENLKKQISNLQKKMESIESEAGQAPGEQELQEISPQELQENKNENYKIFTDDFVNEVSKIFEKNVI